MTKGTDLSIIHKVAASEERQKASLSGRLILENDTESRRTRDAIFTSRIVEKTVNSYMSFELEVKTSGFNTESNTRV